MPTEPKRGPGRPPVHEEPVIVLQVYMPQSLKRQITEAAQRQGLSLSQVVVKALQRARL